MNIKSLLIGSAAALVTVAGAHAADAIVAAEPEPAEYVKVCDAFGAGYFYIPGTETCLKLSGLVRYDIKGGKYYNSADGWSKTSRFQLNVSTAADTEYGALKTDAKIRFNNNNGTDSMDINAATISLGGLTVGQDDSLFTTITGYAGNVIQDGDRVAYGPFDTQFVQYKYDNGAGLTIAGSVEQDVSVATGDDDYVPNLVAGAAYTNGTWGVSGAVGYDEDASAAAIKARVDGKFGGVSVFLMGAYDTDSTTTNIYAPWNGDWAVWAGVSVPASEALSINAQVAYDDAEDLEVAANVAFTVASGFTITPEIDYVKNGTTGDGNWGGILRFNRSF